MVLHCRNQHFVARLQPRPQKGVRNEIDALGRAAHEDYFVRFDAQKLCNPGARALVGIGRALAQRVDAAVDVGVVAAVELVERVEHRPGLVRRRGVVKIDQRLAVDFLLKRREVSAQCHAVERRCAHAASANIPGSRATTACVSSSRSRSSLMRRTISAAKESTSIRRASSWARPRDRR